MSHQAELDMTGLLCPEPVRLLHIEMRNITPKTRLKVITTDPSTTRDIPKFCKFLGYTLIKQEQKQGVYYYWIQKRTLI